MPARTGEEYITGLREHAAEVYIYGEQVKDVTTHPAFRNGVRTWRACTICSTTRPCRMP